MSKKMVLRVASNLHLEVRRPKTHARTHACIRYSDVSTNKCENIYRNNFPSSLYL